MKRNDALDATIAAFRAAGLEPEIERTRRHIKVRCLGLCIIVGSSPSDWRAAKQARAFTRRALRRRGRNEP
jgi:hypothetical protein